MKAWLLANALRLTAAVALLAAVLAGVQTLRLASAHHTITLSEAKAAQQAAEAAAAIAGYRAAQAQAQTAYARGQADARLTYEKETARAKSLQDATVADLRSGTLKLREQWQLCQARSGAEGTASDAAGAAGYDELRAQAIGRVRGVGAEADATYQLAYQTLIQTRALLQACYAGAP